MSSSKKSTGAWGVDFSDPEQAANVLAQLGGEALLKTKYPAVYRAFLKTCDHASKGLYDWDDSDDDFHSGLYCHAPTYLKTESEEVFLIAKVCFQSNLDNYLHLRVAGDFTSAYPPRRHYGSFDEWVAVRNYEYEFKCKIESLQEIKDRKLRMRFGLRGLARGGYLKFADQSVEVVLYTSGGNPITKMTVDDPRSKLEKPNDPIRVYYARKPNDNEKSDYIEDNNKPENNLLKVILPVRGSIEIQSELTFVKVDEDANIFNRYPTLIIEKDSIAQYAISSKDYNTKFKYDESKHKISYELEKDWQNQISLTRFPLTTGKEVRFHVSIPLLLKNNNGMEFTAIAEVTSAALSNGEEYYKLSKTPGVAKIPKIQLNYGCFSRDTFIKMSNGDNRRIDEIQQGDMVPNAEGLPVQVNNIITGYEEELVCIQTVNGRELRLTASHPVLSQGALKSASNIAPGEKLTLDDGTLDTVKFIFLQPYQDQIYSLVTSEKGELLIANGFIAGDFTVQNSFVEPEPETEQEPLTAEEEELLNQFKLLMEELKHK